MPTLEQQIGEIIDAVSLRPTSPERPSAEELRPRGEWTLESKCDVLKEAHKQGLVDGLDVHAHDGGDWIDLKITPKGHAFHENYMEKRATQGRLLYPFFLFVSYCAPYRANAESVADFFRHNLRLSTSQIRCTAAPTTGLQNGAFWESQLLDEVARSRNALFLLSESMIFSTIMMKEFQSRSRSGRKPTFLLLPHNIRESLDESVKVYHAPLLDMDGMMGLLRMYATQLGVTIDEAAATRDAKRIAEPRQPFVQVQLHYEAILSDGRHETVPILLSAERVLPLLRNVTTAGDIRPQLNKLCADEYKKLSRGPAQNGSCIVSWSLKALLKQAGIEEVDHS